MRLTWKAMALSAVVVAAIAGYAGYGNPGSRMPGTFEVAQSVPCPNDRCPR
jgi:hypothetical protein